jgi:hypothetical protein
LLRAAHIKRRSACTDDELRDFRAVAVPACVLGCDAFFELGWVAVDDQGTIEAVGELNEDAQAARSAIVGRRCKAHSEWTSSHFTWHRDRARADELKAEVIAVELPVRSGAAVGS